jgi:hypothetical protein
MVQESVGSLTWRMWEVRPTNNKQKQHEPTWWHRRIGGIRAGGLRNENQMFPGNLGYGTTSGYREKCGFLRIVPSQASSHTERDASERGYAALSRGSLGPTIWSWAPPQLLINFHEDFTRYQDREGSCVEVQVSISIFIFRFSSRKSRIPFPFLDLYLSYRTTIVYSPLPFAAAQHFHPIVWNSVACIHSSSLTTRTTKRH